MPSRPAPTARSSSRSSRTNDAQPGFGGLPVTEPPTDAVPIASIVGAHGLQGLLRVRPYHDACESIEPGAHLWIERGGVWAAVTIESAAPHGQGLLVGLAGVTDRTAAERLAKARLLIRAADLPPLEDDEFYFHEVVGWPVDTLDGRRLGTIVETMDTGLNDVFVVRDDEGREYLIPVIADVVASLDREARRVVIVPMEGLLE